MNSAGGSLSLTLYRLLLFHWQKRKRSSFRSLDNEPKYIVRWEHSFQVLIELA